MLSEYPETSSVSPVAPRRQWIVVGAIAAVFLVATVLRFYQLDVRPFHHDEGVNHHFIEEVIRRGYYPYSHENYHGPLFFYLLTGFMLVFGDGEAAFRALPAVSGILLALLPFCFARTLGLRAAFFGGLLLATSPSLIFYSRYTIHEMLFALAQVVLGLGVFTWWRTRAPAQWYVIWFAMMSLVTLKETFVVSVFWIVLALLSIATPRGVLAALGTSARHIGRAYLASLAFLFFVFSGGFRWFEGLREMIQAFPQWLGRGTSSDPGHFKPMGYYIDDVLWPAEPVTLIVTALAGVLLFYSLGVRFRRGGLTAIGRHDVSGGLPFSARTDLLSFLFVWSAGTLVTYCAIPYKTPWLIISFVAPAMILGGVLCALATESRRFEIRSLGWVIVAVGVLFDSRESFRFNYRSSPTMETVLRLRSMPYGDGNPYTYVHTTDGMRDFVEDLKRYLRFNPSARIVIGVDGYWPLPYYLRNVTDRAGYQRVEDPVAIQGDYDVIVAEHTFEWDGGGDFSRKYYRFTGASETHTYFRKIEGFQ
ncbi:MAG: TIGR03663 family protein [Deltaproteobacteria bacterium]|nr:TIGR03663 family protein [Deltaproteobacteria bacterium]